MKTYLLIILMFSATVAKALEVRVHPGDTVYLYPSSTEATRAGLYTCVIQNIAVVNNGEVTSHLNSLTITALWGDLTLETLLVSTHEMEAMAKKFSQYAEMGVLQMYDFQFQTETYLTGVEYAMDRNLEPNRGLVISSFPMLFVEQPDRLLIVAKGTTESGTEVTAQASL